MIKKFKQYVINMNIMIKNAFVKTHYFIDMIERYHDSLRRIYIIIIFEISSIDFDFALQMIFKIINDFVDFNELIFILLMFETYSKMIENDILTSAIIQRAMIMRKAIKEIKKFIAFKQINDVLHDRNKSIIDFIHALLFNSSILIFRKNNANQSKT